MKKVINVEGMHCEHCVAAVKSSLENLDGVKSAKVTLKTNTATVKLKSDISDNELTNAVESAGFKVIGIEEK